jgi:hypothetical protein
MLQCFGHGALTYVALGFKVDGRDEWSSLYLWKGRMWSVSHDVFAIRMKGAGQRGGGRGRDKGKRQ